MKTLNARSLVVGLIVGGVVAGGVAAMASIPGGGGTIGACYATKDGALRVIDAGAGQTCSSKESALSWNQTGPSGPPGNGGLVVRDGDGVVIGSYLDLGLVVMLPTGLSSTYDVRTGKNSIAASAEVFLTPDCSGPSFMFADEPYGLDSDVYAFQTSPVPGGTSNMNIPKRFVKQGTSRTFLSAGVTYSSYGYGNLAHTCLPQIGPSTSIALVDYSPVTVPLSFVPPLRVGPA
jgi:hypothetical protein